MATPRYLVGPYPFTKCRSLLGFYSRCCRNYKWRDYRARCSSYDKNSQPIVAVAVLEGKD